MPSLRVLVVEDDDATRGLLQVALRDAGYETVAALDGQHALRLALACQPDVIVLDLGLPFMSGIEFVVNWRQILGDDGVPIVVISARPDIRTVARDLHARAAFPKPFDVDALVAAVGVT
ncbi:MAG: response regulator transcription factor [Chloroflexi bacterium]|nr:MAG: response regulator transcription factor [Chloroflexota bacterium]